MPALLCFLVLCVFALRADTLDLAPYRIADRDAPVYAFPASQKIHAILQRNGTHEFVLTNAPALSYWETSDDRATWRRIAGTSATNDARLWRLHRLSEPLHEKFLRLHSEGGVAAGVMIFSGKRASASPWVLIVNSTDDRRLPNHGQEFLPLVRSIPGWEKTPAQQVWVGDFNPSLVNADPPPLAIFFSGSFKDWCEVDRAHWRGVEQVLNTMRIPIWASCGGAQALAILAETGTDSPWDCPHCRDATQPRLPIYTHIGHTSKKPCGDYTGCIFERGPHKVRTLKNDQVFQGLTGEFEVMQSHCGQIEWAPQGWEWLVTAGDGTQTKMQCLRRTDTPIYAAQFHIEMEGTPATSRAIMGNFLKIAKEWRQELFQGSYEK